MDQILKFSVFYANPNVALVYVNQMIDPKLALHTISTMEKGLKRGEDKFKEIASLLNQN